ncbi:hypothetical protein VPNG_04733 [Cytospora leucostoma]|uniref:Uncharacterized protein n=1 Tax=Cytospora leucostoma TaxID=1230097 RepID=A0A423XAE1_9PEZI|nr:hypothetical protein VPNG_04733 [Cytospora leucostoma]
MAPDKANAETEKAEMEKAIRAIYDIMVKEAQLLSKRDIETKAFRRREHDYNNKVAGAKQFPAVNELYAKHNKLYKETVEQVDKDIDGLATSKQKVISNLTECFTKAVKALPINEIKTRQVIDSMKEGSAQETTSSQPGQDDRLQKLEGLVNSLNSKQQAQDIELAKLKKLNDKLRIGESKAEILEKEKEQLRSENLSLKTQLDTFVKRVETIEEWKAVFPSQVESQRLDLGHALEQAKSEWSSKLTTQNSSDVVQDDTTREQLAALGQKDEALSAEIAALRKNVDGHEGLLANVEIEKLDETIEKVSEYPKYAVLNDRFSSQQGGVAGLGDSLQSIKQKLEDDLAERFKGFSGKVVDFCGRKLDDMRQRVDNLETAASSAAANPSIANPVTQAGTSNPESTSASGPELTSDLEGISSRLDAVEIRFTTEESRMTATGSSIDSLQGQVNAIRTEMVAIRDLMDQRYGALETMVESHDDQWKNLTTSQLAQYIFEYLSRLQPSELTPELQQFHTRISDLERMVRGIKQACKGTQDRVRAYCDEEVGPSAKRTYSSDEKFVAMKRARVESMNGVNGVANGHALL